MSCCKDCRYFQEIKDYGADGFCKRYPPIPSQETTFTHGREQRWSFYPRVNEPDWCGEFKAAEKEQAK